MLGKDSTIKSHPHSYDTVLNKTNDVHLPKVHKPDNCILCCCVKTLPSKLCHGAGALLILYKQQKRKANNFADYKMSGIQLYL